jgi:predicted HNH restriction endonuclease
MINKQKDKQYNGQKKKDQGTNNDLQTIQWTKEKRPSDKQWSINRKTNNTMDKRKKTKGQTMIYKQKDKQYNGQKKKDKETNNDLSFCL